MVAWVKSKAVDGYVAVIAGQMITVCRTGDEWVVMSVQGEHEFFQTVGKAKKWAERYFGGL